MQSNLPRDSASIRFLPGPGSKVTMPTQPWTVGPWSYGHGLDPRELEKAYNELIQSAFEGHLRTNYKAVTKGF